ncbi:hypothetical protein ACQPZP_03310 [Spirillospora sp. CA-142024]|uniref:hypothetical protein n=1 Tax=Spirillospora sp. CA-142024 TaxID=3240036 RepID=UPI003D90C7B4
MRPLYDPIVVGPGRAGDAESIRGVPNDAIEHTTAIWTTVKQAPEEAAAWWAELLGRPAAFAVDAAGEVLGYASWAQWHPKEGYRFTVEHSVNVVPGHQGEGIGGRARPDDHAAWAHSMTTALVTGAVAGLGIAMQVGAVAVYLLLLSSTAPMRVGAAAALGVVTVDGLYSALAIAAGSAASRVIEPIAGPLRWTAAAVLLWIAVRIVTGAVHGVRRLADGIGTHRVGAGPPAHRLPGTVCDRRGRRGAHRDTGRADVRPMKAHRGVVRQARVRDAADQRDLERSPHRAHGP